MPLVKAHVEIHEIHRYLLDEFLCELVFEQFDLIINALFFFVFYIWYDTWLEHMLVLRYQLNNQLSSLIYEAIALPTLQLLWVLQECCGCIEGRQDCYRLWIWAEIWALHTHFYQKKCYLFKVFYKFLNFIFVMDFSIYILLLYFEFVWHSKDQL